MHLGQLGLQPLHHHQRLLLHLHRLECNPLLLARLLEGGVGRAPLLAGQPSVALLTDLVVHLLLPTRARLLLPLLRALLVPLHALLDSIALVLVLSLQLEKLVTDAGFVIREAQLALALQHGQMPLATHLLLLLHLVAVDPLRLLLERRLELGLTERGVAIGARGDRSLRDALLVALARAVRLEHHTARSGARLFRIVLPRGG